MKNRIVTLVRELMARFAKRLNKLTRGKIKPSHITTLSLLGHFPVAWALVSCRPILAAVLLSFFSILDALDGALAREQKTTSLSGMYYDAVSDRLKEIIVFSALAVFVVKHIDINMTWLLVAVAGTSLLVSYAKAKGEMAINGKGIDAQRLNRIFSGGVASYEVRVVVIIIGLLSGWILYALFLLLALNSVTVVTRFIAVTNELHDLDADNNMNGRKV
jgi:phosphatidylglycerophosphate synthase